MKPWGPHEVRVPIDCKSGIYSFRCALADPPYVRDIPVIVRPVSDEKSSIAVLANTNTWNAYNFWASYDNTTGPHHGLARYDEEVVANSTLRLSFLRPNPFVLLDNPTPSNTELEPSQHLCRAELWFLCWMQMPEQQKGYGHVDIYSDHDLHSGTLRLDEYKVLILTTHPEYWSVAMYKKVREFLNAGKSVVYLGGNGIFDMVEFADDGKFMFAFGYYNQWPRTKQFTNIGLPEHLLLGDGINLVAGAMLDSVPYIVNPTQLNHHPILQGVGQSIIGTNAWTIDPTGHVGACGWEYDSLNTQEFPPPAVGGEVDVLAFGQNGSAAPFGCPTGQMIWYDHVGGGHVFSVGSITFCSSLVIDRDLQTIFRNVMETCLNG